jgi:hypothetical protein
MLGDVECWGKGDNFGFGGLDIGACMVKVAFDHRYGLRWVLTTNLSRGDVGNGSEVVGINGGGPYAERAGENMDTWSAVINLTKKAGSSPERWQAALTWWEGVL